MPKLAFIVRHRRVVRMGSDTDTSILDPEP